MLVRHAMTLNLSPEAIKAWSPNLDHANVLKTFTSNGTLPTHRQGHLIRAAGQKYAIKGATDPIAELERRLPELRRKPRALVRFDPPEIDGRQRSNGVADL